jgi:hypothetical protein
VKRHYFVFTTFLTGFMVPLLNLLGQSAHEMAGARLLGTLPGGTIALAASHVRPTTDRSAELAEA